MFLSTFLGLRARNSILGLPPLPRSLSESGNANSALESLKPFEPAIEIVPISLQSNNVARVFMALN